MIACEVAATSSQAVRSLVACEPVAAPFAQAAIPALQEAIGCNDLDRAVELVNVQVSGFAEEHVASLRRTAAWSVLRPLAAPVADELTAINSFQPHWAAYANLDMPVTLMVGERSHRKQPYGIAFQRFQEALPQARLVILEEQGHLAHVEAPKVLARHVNRAVGEVLDRLMCSGLAGASVPEAFPVQSLQERSRCDQRQRCCALRLDFMAG